MNDISFENCIKCTVCTTACPVGRVDLGCPRPKQTGPDGKCLRLKDGALYDEALEYCTNCKRCEVARPSDAEIGDIIQRARAKYDTIRPSLRNFMLSHTDLMGGVSTLFAPIVNAATSLKPVWQLLDATLKVDHCRTPPKYSFGTFRRWYHSVAAQQAQYKDQVALLHGCLVNYSHPQLSKGLIRVLNAIGTGVQLLNKEKCYGAPLTANGFTGKTCKQATINAESARGVVRVKGVPVIAASPTCIFALRDEYSGVLSVDNESLRDHIELVTRRLWRKLDEGKTLLLKPLLLKVIYHTPCHTEKIGWTLYTPGLLHKIPGPELTVLDSQCCGIAGVYGFRKESYPTSQAVDAPLLRQVEESGADLTVTDCETCG